MLSKNGRKYAKTDRGEEEFERKTEDKEQIRNLDKWYNDLKTKLSGGLDFQDEEEKLLQENKHKRKQIEAEQESGPVLNKKVVNSILNQHQEGHVCRDISKMFKKQVKAKEAENDENGVEEATGDQPKEKDNTEIPLTDRGKRVPLKSIESRKGEINRFLMNQILLNKYIKKIGTGDITSTTEDLSKQTKNITNDTLQNFKALQSSFGDFTPNIIDYDNLYSKLNQIINAPKENFDFGEDKKKMEELQNDLKTREEYFLNKYNGFKDEIEKKKRYQIKILANLSNNIAKQKSLQQQLDEMKTRYQNLEERLMGENKKPVEPVLINKRATTKPPVQQGIKFNFQDFMKVQKIREVRDTQEAQIEAMMEKVKHEISQKSKQLEEIEKDIANKKFKKVRIRLHLRDLYLKMIKSESHNIFETSIVWIIKALWRINDEVTSEIFPPFLDEFSIGFLIELAQVELKIETLDALVKREKEGEFSTSKPRRAYSSNRRDIILKYDLRKLLEEIQERLKGYKRQNLKVKKPNFLKKLINNRQKGEEEAAPADKDSDDHAKPSPASKFPEEKKEDWTEQLLVHKKLEEDLKEKEIKRLFMIYDKKPHEEKYVHELLRILIALFGSGEAQNLLGRYLKERKERMMRFRDNNTYMFKTSAAYSTDINFRISKEEKDKLNFNWLPKMRNDFNNLETKVLRGSYSILDSALPPFFEKIYKFNQSSEMDFSISKQNLSLPSLMPNSNSSLSLSNKNQNPHSKMLIVKRFQSPDLSDNTVLTTNVTQPDEID